MKPLGAVVTLSLAANVAMAAWLWRGSGAPVAARGAVPASTPAVVTTKEQTGSPATASSTSLRQLTAPPWTELQRGSLTSLVTELRAKGFPPVAVRAVVKAHVKAELAAEYRVVADALATAPYWRADTGLSDPAIDRARRVLDREVEDRAIQLLGPVEGELSPELRVASRRMYGDLPPDKLNQLMRINTDYADLTYQVRAETRGLTLPDDAARLRMIALEQQADIERLLTPEQLQEYGLHGSATANRLRTQLVAFEPTEAEFQALWKLHRAVDLQHGASTLNMTAEQVRQRAAADQDLQQQIAAALGPARYADYQNSRRGGVVIKK